MGDCETDTFAALRATLVLLVTGDKHMPTFLCNMSSITQRQATKSHIWDS